MYFDESNGMTFVSTDFRLDDIELTAVYPELLKISMDKKQNKIIVVFTHEWCIDNKMFEKIEKICNFADAYGYRFTMLENDFK